MPKWNAHTGQSSMVVMDENQSEDLGEVIKTVKEIPLDWQSILMSQVLRCCVSVKNPIEFYSNVDILETLLIEDLYRDKLYDKELADCKIELEKQFGVDKNSIANAFYMFKYQKLIKVLRSKEIKRIEARL